MCGVCNQVFSTIRQMVVGDESSLMMMMMMVVVVMELVKFLAFLDFDFGCSVIFEM